MATKKQIKLSLFEAFWAAAGQDQYNHLRTDNPKEAARLVWNASAGTCIDHARNAINDSWREVVEPISRKKNKDEDAEPVDFMHIHTMDPEAKAGIPIQPDIEPEHSQILDRPTLKEMLQPEPKDGDDLRGLFG